MHAPVSGNEEKARLNLQPVPLVVVHEPAVEFDAQAGTPRKQMNSVAVVLGQGIGIEFRVKPPTADRFAQEQAGRVFTGEITVLQRVVVQRSEEHTSELQSRRDI